jgi:hypothetical protein
MKGTNGVRSCLTEAADVTINLKAIFEEAFSRKLIRCWSDVNFIPKPAGKN